MKVLAFDTSTKKGSVALTDGEKLIAECQQDLDIRHTEQLLPSIDKILNENSWKIGDIEGIAVSIGPGSFTGLRIGLATAKAFAGANNIPLIGVSSLEALACNAQPSEYPVVAILDARRKEVFASLVKVLDEQAISPENLCDTLKKLGPLTLVGDGAIFYKDIFQEKLGKQAHFLPDDQMNIHARWIAHLALPKLKNGEGSDWEGLSPNYLRLSDAELPRKK